MCVFVCLLVSFVVVFGFFVCFCFLMVMDVGGGLSFQLQPPEPLLSTLCVEVCIWQVCVQYACIVCMQECTCQRGGEMNNH